MSAGPVLGRILSCLLVTTPQPVGWLRGRPVNPSRERLAEQVEHALLALVRLGKHRCSCLLQDLEASQLATLGSNIHIHNPTIGRLKVDCVYLDQILSKTNATGFGAILCTHISNVLKSHLYNCHKFIRIIVIQSSTRGTPSFVGGNRGCCQT